MSPGQAQAISRYASKAREAKTELAEILWPWVGLALSDLGASRTESDSLKGYLAQKRGRAKGKQESGLWGMLLAQWETAGAGL